MSCTETGTIGGTIVHAEKRNDEWNAERRKPAPMLAFQRNDTWNDTRIPTMERSNPPLEGGTVERAERWTKVPTPSKPVTGLADLHRYLCRSVGCRFLTQAGWLCRRHEGLVR